MGTLGDGPSRNARPPLAGRAAAYEAVASRGLGEGPPPVPVELAATGRRRSMGDVYVHRIHLAAIVALAAGIVAGCTGPDDEEAAHEVDRFYAAIEAGDGAAACHLLLPSSAQKLSDDAGRPCADAIVDPAEAGAILADRATDSEIRAVHRAGGQAQVVTATDTVFLARSGDAWVVTAVGCDARGDLPYDCEVEP